MAYDVINVLEAGFKNILQQMPSLLRNNAGRKRSKGVTCDMSGDERQHGGVWEHGREIAKALKNVQIEGLTGLIRYKFHFHA